MGAWAAQVLYPIAFDVAWAAVSCPDMGALTAVGSPNFQLSYKRPIGLPWGMDDEDRAIEIEFAVVTVFMAGAFVAGLIALVRSAL